MSQRSEQVSLFAAFHEARVDYAVVGGVAVNAHGFVRNTRDLDVFIRPTVENAEAVSGLAWRESKRSQQYESLQEERKARKESGGLRPAFVLYAP